MHDVYRNKCELFSLCVGKTKVAAVARKVKRHGDNGVNPGCVVELWDKSQDPSFDFGNSESNFYERCGVESNEPTESFLQLGDVGSSCLDVGWQANAVQGVPARSVTAKASSNFEQATGRYQTVACPVQNIGSIAICESANRVYIPFFCFAFLLFAFFDFSFHISGSNVPLDKLCANPNLRYGFCALDCSHPRQLAVRGNGVVEPTGGLFYWDYNSRRNAVKLPAAPTAPTAKPGKTQQLMRDRMKAAASDISAAPSASGGYKTFREKSDADKATKLSQILARQELKKDQTRGRQTNKKQSSSDRSNARSGNGGF